MMKATKVLFSAFVLAGLFSACTDENVVETTQGESAVSGRPQVDLTLSVGAETRMSNGTGEQTLFTKNDVLGAVLVDKGYTSVSNDGVNGHVWNNVDWEIADGHVGNNRWAYDETDGKFKTAGTTAVGAWMFYTKYNEKMTTTRNGVEFFFPQIQEGAADYSYAANNNINFMITPILKIDGYEGEKLNLALQYASVFSYLNIKLAFDAALKVTKVQKIIVSATDQTGATVEFPTACKIVNTSVPEAKLSLTTGTCVTVPNHIAPTSSVLNTADQNAEINIKLAELCCREWDLAANGVKPLTAADWANFDTSPNYDPIVKSVDPNKNVEFLVVDCNSNHEDTAEDNSLAVVANKFSAYMLMPAGIYGSITLDIYTDKGVYQKTVNGRDAYVENKTTPGIPSTTGKIFLRPNNKIVLADVEGKTKKGNADYGVSDYLKIDATATLPATAKQYITKTGDLINFINAIQTGGNNEVNVLAQEQIGDKSNGVDDEPISAHEVVINQEVMTAIEAKEKVVGDIQLTFIGAEMTIKGNETEAAKLNIHDLTFNDGCKVVSGYVKTTDQISVVSRKTMAIKKDANVEFACTNSSAYPLNKVVVEAGAIASVGEKKGTAANTTTIGELENKGTFTVNGTLDVTTLTNYATFTNKKEVVVNGGNNYKEITNMADATITVTGQFYNTTITVSGKYYAGNITNAGLLLVNGSTTPELYNKPSATIHNTGDMYCYNGFNKIYNTGTIYANGDTSTTYITTNSDDDETSTVTNNATMGVIVIESRNQDVSVTTTKQKGYIEYAVKDAEIISNTFGWEDEDKYNRLVLNSATVILDDNLNGKLRYVIAKNTSKLTLSPGLNLQELTFNVTATLYTKNSQVAKFTVADDKTVKIPTENILYVYDVTTATASMTKAQFVNGGTILVGGDLYTSLKESEKGGGTFASGDGESTAFHWRP